MHASHRFVKQREKIRDQIRECCSWIRSTTGQYPDVHSHHDLWKELHTGTVEASQSCMGVRTKIAVVADT